MSKAAVPLWGNGTCAPHLMESRFKDHIDITESLNGKGFSVLIWGAAFLRRWLDFEGKKGGYISINTCFSISPICSTWTSAQFFNHNCQERKACNFHHWGERWNKDSRSKGEGERVRNRHLHWHTGSRGQSAVGNGEDGGNANMILHYSPGFLWITGNSSWVGKDGFWKIYLTDRVGS